MCVFPLTGQLEPRDIECATQTQLCNTDTAQTRGKQRKREKQSHQRRVMSAALAGNAHSIMIMMVTMKSWKLRGKLDRTASENGSQSWWILERQRMSPPANVCIHVKIKATPRSEARIGCRGAGGERIRNHGQKEFKVRMEDGRTARST